MTLAGLAARNILRNRFRAILTMLGVAVAILTFILLRTVVDAWTRGAEFAAKDRVVTRHKVTFVMSLPLRYVLDLRTAAGPDGRPLVKAATWGNWFGGKNKDPAHEKDVFATIAVDAPSFLEVQDNIVVPPDQKETWLHDRQGAIVGDILLKDQGWKVGQKVTLGSTIYPKADGQDWEFTIDGVYEAKDRSADRSSFFFHWDYMNKAMPSFRQDQIGWITSRVEDPNRAAEAGKEIDKFFSIRETETLSQDEASFRTGFLAGISAVLTAVDVISVVILFIMLLILGNTIAMGVRERTNEYGVLKALGFSGRHIATFIVSESMFVGLIGGAIGVGIAYPFVNLGIGRYLEEHMGRFFPYFRVDPRIAALAAGLALVLGALAALLPAIRASRLKVVDAVRRVA